jgi:hypothetical protein
MCSGCRGTENVFSSLTRGRVFIHLNLIEEFIMEGEWPKLRNCRFVPQRYRTTQLTCKHDQIFFIKLWNIGVIVYFLI